jgi:hypothetical protein
MKVDGRGRADWTVFFCPAQEGQMNMVNAQPVTIGVDRPQ